MRRRRAASGRGSRGAWKDAKLAAKLAAKKVAGAIALRSPSSGNPADAVALRARRPSRLGEEAGFAPSASLHPPVSPSLAPKLYPRRDVPSDKGGPPRWDYGSRPATALACAPMFAPQIEAHYGVANAFTDLEDLFGRYTAKRASRFMGLLLRRPEYPVILTRLPFSAVEQVLFAISMCRFHELFVWAAELVGGGAPSTANCPSLSELGQSGGRRRPAGSASFQELAPLGAEAWRPPEVSFRQAPAQAAPECGTAEAWRERLMDQFALPAAVTLASDVNLHDRLGRLRVRRGRFTDLLDRLAAKYRSRREDFLELAYSLLAKASKKQTAFVAVYVGPSGRAGESPCGARDAAPEFRQQRVFEWRILGRLTPATCYQTFTALPLIDPDAPAGALSCSVPPPLPAYPEDLPRITVDPFRLPRRTKAWLGLTIGETVRCEWFRTQVIRRFAAAGKERIAEGRVIRVYLLGQPDVPFVSVHIALSKTEPNPAAEQLPEALGMPDGFSVTRYDMALLQDPPWTNVVFADDGATPSTAKRSDA
jgi:hypothetical protein